MPINEDETKVRVKAIFGQFKKYGWRRRRSLEVRNALIIENNDGQAVEFVGNENGKGMVSSGLLNVYLEDLGRSRRAHQQDNSR